MIRERETLLFFRKKLIYKKNIIKNLVAIPIEMLCRYFKYLIRNNVEKP